MSEAMRREHGAAPAGLAVGGVSVRGASHAAAKMPNQDAFGHESEDGSTCLAVADGHGAKSHYRSDRGSCFAVETVLPLLRGALRRIEEGGAGLVLASLAQDLADRWRERVEEDIRRSPIAERSGPEALAVYGSTCVAGAIGASASLFLQIGDGDVLASVPGGEVERLVPLDLRLVGAETYSLCQPDAAVRTHLRLFTPPHPLARPDFVMVATDGLSKSYPKDEDFLAAARHFRRQLATTPLPPFLHSLEPWLGECSARGSRDDVTIAIYNRQR